MNGLIIICLKMLFVLILSLFLVGLVFGSDVKCRIKFRRPYIQINKISNEYLKMIPTCTLIVKIMQTHKIDTLSRNIV